MSKWSEGTTPARILEFRSDFDTYQVGRYAGESILCLAAVLPYPAVTVGQTGYHHLGNWWEIVCSRLICPMFLSTCPPVDHPGEGYFCASNEFVSVRHNCHMMLITTAL